MDWFVGLDSAGMLYSAIMKELVEHIRTVHFTVLVIALALTAALQIEPKRPLERAASDAEAVLLLSQRWKETSSTIDKAVMQQIQGGRYKDVVIEPNAKYHVHTLLDGEIAVNIAFSSTTNWALVKRVDKDTFRTSRGLQQWTTLRDFLEFWDEAEGEGRSGFIPIVLPKSTPTKTQCGDVEIRKKEFAAHGLSLDYNVLTYLHMENWRMEPRLYYYLGKEGVPLSQTAESCLFPPVEVHSVDVDLSRVFQPIAPEAAQWGTGSSATEFPELISASKFLEDTPLQNLASALRDRANADTERVEIFQAKLPASSIPTFGSIILILCELYLLAHLFELRKLLEQDESAEWPSGYIGLYSNMFIFAFTLLTLVVFPLIPLVWSAVRYTGHLRFLSIVACAISLLLGLGCSWTLFLIRKQHLIVSPDSLI